LGYREYAPKTASRASITCIQVRTMKELCLLACLSALTLAFDNFPDLPAAFKDRHQAHTHTHTHTRHAGNNASFLCSCSVHLIQNISPDQCREGPESRHATPAWPGSGVFPDPAPFFRLFVCPPVLQALPLEEETYGPESTCASLDGQPTINPPPCYHERRCRPSSSPKPVLTRPDATGPAWPSHHHHRPNPHCLGLGLL
jgi:hypothetical protein